MNAFRVIPRAAANLLGVARGDSATSLRRGMTLLALLLAPTLASACPVCFGAAGSTASKAASNGIFFLLGVIGFVQMGFVAMFIGFWRRARALRAHRDSFRVIDGGPFK